MNNQALKNKQKVLVDCIIDNLLDSCEIAKTEPIDVYSLAKKIGCRIVVVEGEDESGFVSMFGKNGKKEVILGVNPNFGSTKNREIIANEIAHLFLDNKKADCDYVYKYSRSTVPEPTLITYFTNSLLLPKQQVSKLIKNNDSMLEKLDYIADVYDVEEDIVLERINELRYVL